VLIAQVGETLNPKWTRTPLHGRRKGRICEILPQYWLLANTLRYTDGLPLLYTALESPLQSGGILALTRHQGTNETIETGFSLLEDWRLRTWLFSKSIRIFALEEGSPPPLEGPGAPPPLPIPSTTLRRASSSSESISGLNLTPSPGVLA
jgi:hypothetical protein